MRCMPWRWGDPECDVLSVLAIACAVVLLTTSSGTGAPRQVPPPLALNPNTAPELVLNALPRVGPATAARIVAARAQRPFRKVEDLDRVRGIGPSTVEALRPYLRTDLPGP